MTSLNVPPDLPLSFYLLKQCKLWIWDFDDTLIIIDTYLKKDMSPSAILKRSDTELDNEIPQWRYFRKLIEFLVMHGRYVGIASFGTYEIIQAYMKRIMGFNQQFFTKKNIIAPEMKFRDVYRFNIPPNKNEYVYQLMRIYRVQDFKRVVLFDDKPSNIADAIAIGIVGIQIATPSNGDKPNSGKMYFGPWVMQDFDTTISTKCGDEIYLNRTYTGIASKENYTATAYNNPPKEDINFGTGVRSTDGNLMEYTLGMNDSGLYRYTAFGTGIGDRKVLSQPQYRWNAYRDGKVPKWINGNYVNVQDKVKTEGYWEDNYSLGGDTMSFWDTYQTCGTKHNSNSNSRKQNKSTPEYILEYNSENNEGFHNMTDNNNYNDSNNSNNNSYNDSYNYLLDSGCGCKKFEWNWIILLLILLVVIMVVIVIRC
jgi:hypothetical protein